MDIKYLLKNLDRSDSNSDAVHYNLEGLVSECSLDCWGVSDNSEGEDVRLKAYWMANHYCTDSYVGYRAYFLDGIFVCLSYQGSRKSDEEYEWLSKEAFLSVRDYLLSLVVEDEEIDLPTEFINLDEDIGDGYPIQYTGQLLRKEVLYKGKLVDVIKDDSDGYRNFHTITIKEKDTSREVDIDIRNILLPWYVSKENK